jgi:Ca-activated chloride channel family protein
MRFALPWFFLLYLPLAILVVLSFKMKAPTLRLPSIKLLKTAHPSKRFSLFSLLPSFLFVLAVALLILALTRPQYGVGLVKQKAEGIDIMLALDLSGSMDEVDVPASYTKDTQVFAALKDGYLKKRIDIAKSKIKEFIDRRPNDRIGLIAFANQPYVACPPTLDHAWLFGHLDRLTPGLIGGATGIAGPIASAVYRLKDSDSKRKIVVLFTDGSNNVKARVSPRQAAKLAKTFGIKIYTIGIGSSNAYVVQQHPFYGQVLQKIDSQFDEPLMKDIAKISGAVYFKAADEKGLETVMNEIDKLEKTTRIQPRYIDYHDIGPTFIKIALALLIASFVFGNTFFLKIP